MKPYLTRVVSFLLAADIIMVSLAHGRIGLSTRLIFSLVCLNLYLALFLLLGHPGVQLYLQAKFRNVSHVILFCVVAFLSPFLIYAIGTGTFRWFSFLKLAAYTILPCMVLLTVKVRRDRLLWQDACAILALWIPLDFRWMKDLWAWPENSLGYSMNSLLATSLAVTLFVCLRQLRDVGYQFKCHRKDWTVGCRNFLFFAPIAVPVGLYTGFISFSSCFDPPWELVLSAVGIFLLVAVPEELLFRGIILNFVERSFLKPFPALVVTSVLFGAAHLNNGPSPDWRYFLLASIAGLFYGNAYLETRKLMAPAIVHTMVDTIWRGFFR